MSLAKIRITRGLSTNKGLNNPSGSSCLPVASKMFHFGNIDTDNLNVSAIQNNELNFGIFKVEPHINCKSVTITFTPTSPTIDNYRRFYAIVRGRYEYKTNITDTNVKILHTDTNFIPQAATITDDTCSPDTYYYYAVIALMGGNLPARFEYNINSSLDYGYRYSRYGHGTVMYDLLPLEWRKQDESISSVTIGDYSLTGGFVERYIEILGLLFDSLKSDIDTHIYNNRSIYDVSLSTLNHLLSLIGWNPNQEYKGELQRKEANELVPTYKKKGRDESISDFITTLLGFSFDKEEGYRRVITTNSITSTTVDTTDTYATSNIDAPSKTVSNYVLGSSNGSASQTFVLYDVVARRIILEVSESGTFEEWIEVSSFASSSATDLHYTVAENSTTLISTITFGNGTNGKIPTAGSNNIRVTYTYGGDIVKYVPDAPPGWKNDVSTRFRIKELSTSNDSLRKPIVDKIDLVINKLKASYANYNIIYDAYVPDENIALFSDSYTDTIS
tara:strand:+ start:10365 stop:11873 length:1509 start_codon:yes stop_codon:yes gene_type:complete